VKPYYLHHPDLAPAFERHAEMRGAGREIGVMEVVGFHARTHQRPEQRFERRRVVVDALEQHRLRQHRDSGIDDARDRGARGWRQLAGVIAVNDDIRRLFVLDRRAQSRDHCRVDGLRHRDRRTGVDADDAEMRNRREPGENLGHAADRQQQRLSAGEDRLPDFGVPRDVGDGGVELGHRQGFLAGAHGLAPKAEAAVDGAGVLRLEQHAVAVAVDDALDRRVRRVADRIG
jgi:hypothetical protein